MNPWTGARMSPRSPECTNQLDDQGIIDRLNANFVPVYAVNEDYRAEGVVPKEDQAEYRRVYR